MDIAVSRVVVTGRSLAIGLATVRACADRGARVSAIGRGRERPAAAGQAEPGYFLDLEPDSFRRQMELTSFGTLNAVRAVLPAMVKQARGHVVLLSSVSGWIGVFGYGAYTPTKFAVRGLGEALHAEFRSQAIVTSIMYPADTDTPGFHRENLTKPPGTARLSAGIAPVSAGQVATAIVRGIEHDRLHLTADLQTRIIARLADLHGPPIRAAMRWRLRRRASEDIAAMKSACGDRVGGT